MPHYVIAGHHGTTFFTRVVEAENHAKAIEVGTKDFCTENWVSPTEVTIDRVFASATPITELEI